MQKRLLRLRPKPIRAKLSRPIGRESFFSCAPWQAGNKTVSRRAQIHVFAVEQEVHWAVIYVADGPYLRHEGPHAVAAVFGQPAEGAVSAGFALLAERLASKARKELEQEMGHPGISSGNAKAMKLVTDMIEGVAELTEKGEE